MGSSAHPLISVIGGLTASARRQRRTEGNIKMRTAGAARPEGLSWQISSYCNNGSCVQVSQDGGAIFLGDSKDPEGPTLSYTLPGWKILIADIKSGRFDHI
jgi:hypothetical protein